MQSGNANARVKQAIAKRLPWKAGTTQPRNSKLLYLRPRSVRAPSVVRPVRLPRLWLVLSGFAAGGLVGYGFASIVDHAHAVAFGALVLGGVAGAGLMAAIMRRALRRAVTTSDMFRERLMNIERNQALWLSLSAVLHDVRNPLHNIALLMETMEAPGNDPCAVRGQIMSELERINVRMRRVTRQVSEFSGEIDRQPVALPEVIDEVRTMVESFAQAQPSVTVNIERASNVTVIADRKLLVQAIDHLMLNSLQILAQRNDRHYRLSLSTTVEERIVWLWVEDTGPGLPASVQEHLFERLAAGSANGMGLGLAIAHALASAAGGELMLARTGDRGTQFRLRLERAL